MKIYISIVFLVFVANQAFSQTPEINIGVGINSQIPPENFEHNHRSGLYLQGSYFIPIGSLLKIGVEGSYTRLLIDDDSLLGSSASSLSVDGLETQLITSFLSFRAYKDIMNNTQVYSTLGFGVFYQIQNEGIIGDGVTISKLVSDKTTDFGMKLGFGMSTTLSNNIGIYLESGYMIGFTQNKYTQLIPIAIGVKRYFR